VDARLRKTRTFMAASGPLGARNAYWTGLAAIIGWLTLRTLLRYTRRPPIQDTAENREWLARILMTEAAFRGEPDYKEWAGISWVAINRAIKAGHGRIRPIVDASGWFGKAPPSRMYGRDLLTKGNGPKAVAFVNSLFEGKVGNFISSRRLFFHITGMPKCNRAGVKSGRYICIDYGEHGKHKAPLWGVHPSDGGSAKTNPLRGKRTVFA